MLIKNDELNFLHSINNKLSILPNTEYRLDSELVDLATGVTCFHLTNNNKEKISHAIHHLSAWIANISFRIEQVSAKHGGKRVIGVLLV